MQKLILLVLLLSTPIATLQAKDFYVSIQGNDQWTGTAPLPQQQGDNGPFRSLQRAQTAIRDLKKNSQFTEAVTVHIDTGTYRLDKALIYDIRDTGFAERPIRWQGEHGKVLISGGIELTNCRAEQGTYWRCPTTDLNLDTLKYPNADRLKGSIPGFEVFLNDQRLTLARWPNQDWVHIRLPLDEKTRFSSIESLPVVDPQAKNIQVHIMAGNDWYDQYLPVQSVDAAQNQIMLSAPTGYLLTSGYRYYLRNIEAQLDAPGEWFYNQTGNYLAYIAPSGSQPGNVTVSASKNLLQIAGANYLSFADIALAHSTDTAVVINHSHHLGFDHVEISNVGNMAINAEDSSNISIANSHIHHTGATALTLNGGDRKTLQSADNIVHNNHIHHFGETILTYSPAIRVQGVGGQITHNLFEYAGGEAIEFKGNDYLIEKNEIHHVCEQASDCGAIYTGRDWTYRGNIVRYNHLHDLSGYGLKSVDVANNRVEYASPAGARGIYLDDAVSGITVYGNLFNNAGQMAIQLGGGRDNIIDNNIIVTDGGYAIWVDNRWPAFDWSQLRKNLQQVPYTSAIWRGRYPSLAVPMNNAAWPEGNSIQHNIIVSHSANALVLRYQMPFYSNTLATNLVWSANGAIGVDYDVLDHLKHGGGAPWTTWLTEGVEKNSISADPCLTVTGNRVSFCSGSPVGQIGFKPLPDDIGLLK